jgi:hypothetical protein
MRGAILAVAACAPAAAADVTILDQIGPQGADLRDAQGNVTGYFNHYSTPPVGFGNRGVLDDFVLSERMRITRVEAAVAASPGSSVNWNNLIAWRVEVYSNPQVALNHDLVGDLLHAQITTPASFVIPYTSFNFGPNPIGLVSLDVDVTLEAGMYWVAVIPLNTATNGYTTVIGSTVGNQFIPWQVLPGSTVVPLSQAGIGFRVFGQSAAACYANCDGSTGTPVLNINDFICFQSRFAAGDSYANCDGSTTAPVLNVNDFICFQGQFAAGCP